MEADVRPVGLTTPSECARSPTSCLSGARLEAIGRCDQNCTDFAFRTLYPDSPGDPMEPDIQAFCERHADRLREIARACPDPVLCNQLLARAEDWVTTRHRPQAIVAFVRLVQSISRET
jgi:hypothetical protein